MNALAVAIVALSCAAYAASNKQLALIEGWERVKDRAARARDVFLANVAKDATLDLESFDRNIRSAWAMCQSIEDSERARRRILSQDLMVEYSLRRIDDLEYRRRGAAVERLFQARMTFIYGSIFPRILDEAVNKGAGDVGRTYAGSDWRLEISQQEAQTLWREFAQESGFPMDRVDGPLPRNQ